MKINRLKSTKMLDNIDSEIKNCIILYGNILKNLGYKNTIKEEIEDLKNFIDKMAIWYELKFNDPLISKLFQDENINLNSLFFREKNSCKELNEDPIYDTHTFLNKYLYNEKYYLNKPTFPNVICLDNNRCFYLTKKGIIYKATGFKKNNKDYNYIFEGQRITKVHDIAKENKIVLKDENNKILSAICEYHNKKLAKEIILDAIMYKILKRGDKNIGAKRALLFAIEFKRDLEKVMKYAMDLSNKNNENLINIYLNHGGKEDIDIILNYHTKNPTIISLKDYIIYLSNNKTSLDKPLQLTLNKKDTK